jgi:hypothetical protein
VGGDTTHHEAHPHVSVSLTGEVKAVSTRVNNSALITGKAHEMNKNARRSDCAIKLIMSSKNGLKANALRLRTECGRQRF